MSELAKTIWYWVANIGSLASLIALPIALLQLYDIRKKLKNSDEITNRFLEREKRLHLEVIRDILSPVNDKLIGIKTSYKKQGVLWRDIQNEIEKIIQTINKATQQLPADYSDLDNQLRSVIEELQLFLTVDINKKNDSITEAEALLHESLESIKTRIESMAQIELSLIVKSEKG